MAAYDPVQDVIEEEGLSPAPRAQPVFQPDTPAYDPVQDVITEERPIFQRLHPDAQADGSRPVFQSAHGPEAEGEIGGGVHIEMAPPGQTPKRWLLPEGFQPLDSDQQPIEAPRAYTRDILAARQQAEQYGADFAQRAPRAGAVGAAAQQALQFDPTSASAAAAAGQQNFVQQHAQAQVNSPVTLDAIGQDLGQKLIGNFQSLFNTLREGTDTDDLLINQAVDQMLPDGSPEDKAAFRRAFIAGTPDQRSQWIGALMPYVSAQPIDPAALSDALDRKADPAYQAARAKSLADAQASAIKNLQGDPRLKGTMWGNVISQVAALPSYAAAANPLVAPVGLPMIFSRIFTDSRQAMQQQHPDWNDQQLDQSAAESAIINTVGAEAGSRIIGAGLGPLLRNVRGGYLARAAVQVPATAAAQAGVGAATQAATNIAQGQPVGQSVVEAALGQGIVGGAAGAIHATVRPPLAPEVAPTTGPSGARVRGPTEATLEAGAAKAAVPPVEQPAQPPAQPPVTVSARTVPDDIAAALQRGQELEAQGYGDWEVTGRDPETGNLILTPRKTPAAPEEPSVQPAVQLPAVPEERPVQPVRPEPVSPRAEPPPSPVTAEEPWVSSIANRFTQERSARGEIGEIAPGQGYATQDLVDLGRRMKPEEVTQHMSDLMNNWGGDPIRQAAAIRYEEARLSERNQQLGRVAEANPGDVQAQIDADNAFKDLTDFHNGPLARQKNVWHAQGMSMQGEIPVDLSTYNGLREQWLRDQNGKAPPPEAEPVIRRRAAQIRDAAIAEDAVRKNATEIDRYPEEGLPSDEDLRRKVRETMGQIPCIPI